MAQTLVRANSSALSNPGVILLIILAIILTIALITLLSITAVNVSNTSNSTGTTGSNILPPCRSSVNISSLIQIPDSLPNCVQNGVTGSLYYIGNLGSQNYDFVVAPWGSQPLNVCIGFCTGYTGGICNGPNYNGRSAQANFDRCMQQLSSTDCIPPLPLAARGTTLYYGYSPTSNICGR